MSKVIKIELDDERRKRLTTGVRELPGVTKFEIGDSAHEAFGDHDQIPEKPENCNCAYPELICRSMSNHDPSCPVHIAFMERVPDPPIQIHDSYMGGAIQMDKNALVLCTMSDKMKQDIARIVHESFPTIATVKLNQDQQDILIHALVVDLIDQEKLLAHCQKTPRFLGAMISDEKVHGLKPERVKSLERQLSETQILVIEIQNRVSKIRQMIDFVRGSSVNDNR